MASAPTVVIGYSPSTVTRVSPFPITFEVVNNSVLGTGAWDQALCWWDINDPSGVFDTSTAIDPITNESRSWINKSYGRLLGGITRHGIAGTVTITAYVKQIDDQVGSGIITLSSTGSPDIPFSLRSESSGWWLVSSSGDDISPPGVGSRSNPKNYRTFRSAIAVANSGVNPVVLFQDDEIHEVSGTSGGSISMVSDNMYIARTNNGINRPIILPLVDLQPFTARRNTVFSGLQLRPSVSITGAISKAFSIANDSVGFKDINVEGSLAGNGYEEIFGITSNRTGCVVMDCDFYAVRRHVMYTEAASTYLWNVKAYAGREEQIFRLGPLTNIINFCYCISNYTSGTASKTPLRTAFSDHCDVFHSKLVGTTQLGHSAGVADPCQFARFDGCLLEFVGGDNACMVLMDSVRDATICNCIFDCGTTVKGALSTRPDSGNDNTYRVKFLNNTWIHRVSGTASIASIGGTFVNDFIDMQFDNNLVMTHNKFNNRWFTAGSGKYFKSVNNNVFGKSDGITDATAVASFYVYPSAATITAFRGPTTTPTFASFTASGQNVSGIWYETIEPSSFTLSTNYRPASGMAATGASTPMGVYHDLFLRSRSAISYIGAVDTGATTTVENVIQRLFLKNSSLILGFRLI